MRQNHVNYILGELSITKSVKQVEVVEKAKEMEKEQLIVIEEKKEKICRDQKKKPPTEGRSSPN